MAKAGACARGVDAGPSVKVGVVVGAIVAQVAARRGVGLRNEASSGGGVKGVESEFELDVAVGSARIWSLEEQSWSGGYQSRVVQRLW